MSESKKSVQNKSYYQKNREKILERARQRTKEFQQKIEEPLHIVPLFEKAAEKPLKPKKKEKNQKNVSNGYHKTITVGLLGLLVLSLTGFLVHESAKFFVDPQEGIASAYFKALILESVAVAFSFLRGRNFGMGVVYKLMVVVVYSYSIWVVSGPIVDSSIHKKDKIVFHQRSIQALESEITKKEAIRDLYWKLDRVTSARKYDLALELLKEKLMATRASLVEMPNLVILQHQLWASVGFRVLVMIANFLCLQYLGIIFRL